MNTSVGGIVALSLLLVSMLAVTNRNGRRLNAPQSHHSNNNHQGKAKAVPSLLPHNDPRTVQLKTHHPLDPQFQEKSKALKGLLTDSELKSIQDFSSTLRESHCRREEHSFQSLNRYIHTKFSVDQRVKWMNPSRGVVRSINQESNIPCDGQYWVQDGWWQSVPMWSHCCNQGAAIAKCPTPVQETPSHCSVSDALTGKRCESDGTLLCNNYISDKQENNDCLVYTFGIADQWDFEDFIGTKGCEVHAHDPTTRYKEIHEAHNAQNVNFHYQGLGVEGATAKEFTGYGKLGGPMMTLGELWRDHGHAEQKRRIDILKIDCEGCEFEAFHHLATKEPEVISNVCTIIIELHFSESLQMESAHQLKLMASFWEKYVVEFGFRFWYLHENPGAHFDQKVNPLLLDIGMDPTICCYEIALRRPGCDEPTTNI